MSPERNSKDNWMPFSANWRGYGKMSVISVALGSLVSILTLFASNPEQSGSSAGLLTPTTPTASTSTTGWIVANLGPTTYSRMSFRQERVSAEFGSTAQPSGAPAGLAQDSWRISAATTGDFSAGTWYSNLSLLAVTSGGSAPVANVLYSGASAVNASTYTSTSNIQASANALVLLTIATGGTLRTVNSVAGGGISTWVSVDSITFNATNKLSIWRGMSSSPVASSRVTVVLSGTVGNCLLGMVEFLGVDATGSNGANAIVSSATTLGTTSHMTNIMPSVSSADNIIYGAFSFVTRNAGYAPGANFTELWDLASGEAVNTSLHGIWSTSSLTRPASKGVQSLAGAGIALELKTVFPSGRARTRLWRSANADGTSATELTQGTMVGSTVEGLSTTVAQSSSASTQIGAFSLANEYLFAQTAWENITPGLVASNDRLIRFGSLDATSGSGLITADFATAAGGAAVGAGYYLWYYQNVVEDLV